MSVFRHSPRLASDLLTPFFLLWQSARIILSPQRTSVQRVVTDETPHVDDGAHLGRC
jgi:hypothetical protein